MFTKTGTVCNATNCNAEIPRNKHGNTLSPSAAEVRGWSCPDDTAPVGAPIPREQRRHFCPNHKARA